MTLNTFIQQIINGLHVGSMYALIALGYTMVYGIVRLINFAHGDILMLGAYFGFFALTAFGLPFALALLVALLLSAGVGMAIEKIAYKPLRNAPKLSALITALGVSMFLENGAKFAWGAKYKVMPEIIKVEKMTFLGIEITNITILTIALSIVFMVLLEFIVRYTKTGAAMRAVSEDKGAAKLMGINVNRTISITFALGSSLGAVGGILWSINYYQIAPLMGMMPGLKAFVAAVLGGIGIIPGAMLGGFLIGMVETFTRAAGFSTWADAVVFGLLILVLLFKPSGILGKNTKEKV